MAYTINLTDGSIFATIADGTINTTSSMILVGKNYAGYGEFLDENFIHLLENGSNTTAPGNPLTGQLWWDKTNNVMKVYNGTTFKVISASTASSTAPTSNVAGDLWFDTVNQQLKVYNGTQFILVGPASSAGQGTSGAVVTTITDNLSVDHVVIQFFVANSIVGIMSKDSTFTPQTAISGFSTIGPGLQLSTTVSSALFRGTATDSNTVGGIPASGFLSSTTNSTTVGTLGVLNDTGFTVGAVQSAQIQVITANSEVVLRNQSTDSNLSIRVNDGGVDTPVMQVNGSTGVVTFPTTVVHSGTLSAGNLSVGTGTVTCGNIVNANGNGVGNIGSSINYFNTVFAKATAAEYADVAERFAADQEYLPGTIVEIGGTAEITQASVELSDNVFGVISTRAAYLMNSGAGTDSTHPPIAMTGRVPVRTVGQVRKGDRLVSAGNGLARAALPGEATAFNVIGRALEEKVSDIEGMVEAIVTTK
jgi:hypothetical protein